MSVVRYNWWAAKSYDWLKKKWTPLFAAKAEALLGNFLIENVDESKEILELGCGTAMNLDKIVSLNRTFKSYLGLDYSEEMMSKAKDKFRDSNNIEFRKADITQLNSLKSKYDVIICTWVLSHIKSPSAAINDAQQHLKNNGKMFLIFLTKPKCYINFWFHFVAKYLFKSKYITEEEVRKFKNVKRIHKLSEGLVTVVEI